MTLRILKTKKDYNEALKRFEEIFQAKTGTKESDEADVLSLLIREYEEKHFVIKVPNPLEAITLLFAIILFLNSCGSHENDCPPVPQVITKNLHENDRSKIPYSGIDTLVYLNGSGDSLTTLGQGKISYYEEHSTYGAHPQCEPNKERDEAIKIDFKSVQDTRVISMKLTATDWNVKYYFDGVQFVEIGVVSIDDSRIVDYVFHDSISLHGRMWYRVSQIQYSGKATYINKANGIIQFQEGSNTWTLK